MNKPIPTREVDGQLYMATTDISDYFGVMFTATLITQLVGPPCHRKKAGSYWKPERLPQIRDAFVRQMNSLPCV